MEAYEELRKAVVEGRPRREGFATLRFHGLLEGLPLLVAKEASGSPSVVRRASVDPPPPADEFVCLLASLVLFTHSEELAHVY